MIVAIIALVLAASGSAVAATSLVSGDQLIKKDSLSGNRLRAHTITGKQLDLRKLGTVPDAEVAHYAGVALHASSADSATNAASASALGGVTASAFAPVLYVHVFADGTIDTAQAKNMGGVTIVLRKHSAYCFSGLPFAPRGGSATIDFARGSNGGTTEQAQLAIADPGQTAAIDCQPGENVEVSTTAAAGTFAPEAFYLALYG